MLGRRSESRPGAAPWKINAPERGTAIPPAQGWCSPHEPGGGDQGTRRRCGGFERRRNSPAGGSRKAWASGAGTIQCVKKMTADLSGPMTRRLGRPRSTTLGQGRFGNVAFERVATPTLYFGSARWCRERGPWHRRSQGGIHSVQRDRGRADSMPVGAFRCRRGGPLTKVISATLGVSVRRQA